VSKTKHLLYLIIFSLLFIPLAVEAWAPIDTSGAIQTLLGDIADWLYAIGLAVALIVIIVGGIMYMTSGGNEEKTNKAKKTIISGLIGAGIVILAGVILDTVRYIIEGAI